MSEADLLLHDAAAYLKAEDVKQLQSAFEFSEAAHEGQFRQSGEPYISHPVAVATILAQWHMDPQALTAALLHDVMEDTTVTKGEISDRFGKLVAELVDGVSKLDKIEFQSQEQAQAENFRKMFLAMARDVRVILIKLADRLHNMRTLEVMHPTKRARIARETLEIYAPIANRLGLNALYIELQELAFQNLYPNRWRVLRKAVEASRGNRKEVVERILGAIQQKLQDAGIDAFVTGREKNLYSIYKKMQDKNLSFSEVLDIYGFRVIVRDAPACYLALGALHSLYKPIPGKFKDYIAIPKANGYQSLHTTLFGPFSSPIEIQIRTQEMHRIADAGVASHWLYKTSDASLNELQRKTHQWLQSLLEMQSEGVDSAEFLEHLKVDLFPDETYVFTPKGRIMALPHGATCVDFAYAVHTDIGNRCVAAKVNHELVPLRSELKNGDRVEIITAAHAKPNPAWLNFVITAKARHHIRHFLRTMQYEESAHLGERLLHQAITALGGNPKALRESDWERALNETGAKSRQEALAEIGLGRLLAVVVARKLLPPGRGEGQAGLGPTGPIVIRGSEGMALQFAKCCHPIPGDPIQGFITRGKGVTVHLRSCPTVMNEREVGRLIEVEWEAAPTETYPIAIRVEAYDRTGLLNDITQVVAEHKVNIVAANVSVSPDHIAIVRATIQVASVSQLARVLGRIEQLKDVIAVTRDLG
jgi:GTP pyrophosphokinase